MNDLERPAGPATPGAIPPAPASDAHWRTTRERVREIIRAEVDRFHPTDDARYPLELIVESSVRFADSDGTPAITVVDDAGRPRQVTTNGQTVPFTIGDLLEEMRRARPMLFKPDGAAAAPKASAAAAQMRQRDWLDLGPDEETPPAPAPPPAHGLRRLRRGRARLHLRTRAAPGRIEPAPDGAARLQTGRPDRPRGMAPMPDAPVDRRLPSAGRGLAIGALAVAALIGVGSFALSGRDQPAESTQAASRVEEPTATGTVASMQASSETAAIAPPTGGRMLRGVPDVIDTATLSLQGEVVRLFGVEWAPGGGKPDDLTQYLQGREVACEQTGSEETYRCRVGGQDLSRVVLFNGGGKATAEATPELKSAEEKARTAQLGVWSRQP
jgi:endonuclease YncB( thermonuclease family)